MNYTHIPILVLLMLSGSHIRAQYEFTGEVTKEESNGTLYLSLVTDYHKLDGIFSEQIINSTDVKEDGSFRFTGDNLPEQPAIYKIHIDSCPEDINATNHAFGHCKNSQEVHFIAGPKDTLYFPTTKREEIFCSIAASKARNNALFKIDSLKELAAYDIAATVSKTQKELELKKWLKKLQEYSKGLNEPLAELYTYAYVSNRAGELYPYYLEDGISNDYYVSLGKRLKESYPNSAYAIQYESDLRADTFLHQNKMTKDSSYTNSILVALLLLSLVLNIYLIFQRQKNNTATAITQKLTPQEQKIVSMIQAGKTNKEIATALFISVSTVKTHINNSYKKLGITSREEL